MDIRLINYIRDNATVNVQYKSLIAVPEPTDPELYSELDDLTKISPDLVPIMNFGGMYGGVFVGLEDGFYYIAVEYCDKANWSFKNIVPKFISNAQFKHKRKLRRSLFFNLRKRNRKVTKPGILIFELKERNDDETVGIWS